MSPNRYTVKCESHGEKSAAYVCSHLLVGENQGFYWGVDPEDPDWPFPDAWCSDCERFLDDEGEWTEKAMNQADIRVVCAECYVDIRARNWREDSEELERQAVEVNKELMANQADLWERFEIERWERWDWFMETQQLVFSHESMPKVAADVAFIGSQSSQTGTWLWSWANTELPGAVRERSIAVRDYGEANHFMKLATGYWRAEEDDGWLMTAFASRILGGIGAYRTPREGGHTYMVILDAKWAQ